MREVSTVVQRQIFLHGPLGQRQLCDVLGAQLAMLILAPEPLWLVSPWLSDFALLDNRAGQWGALTPGWEQGEIGFIEVLAQVVNSGCALRLVTRDDGRSLNFVERLQAKLSPQADFRWLATAQVHTKGLLCGSFFLKGSMNFTWSGTHRNDEHLTLTCDRDILAEAQLEFDAHYQFDAGAADDPPS